jgi:hypothetical protein
MRAIRRRFHLRNREKQKAQKVAKKAKMFLSSLQPFAPFASSSVCNAQTDLIWFVLAV